MSSTSSSYRLKDRTAIVSGGSSGIGRAICLAYAKEGAKVLVADLRPESRNPLEADSPTHQLIQSAGGDAAFLKVDVTAPNDLAAAVKDVVARWGRLDIMVNNAGVSAAAPASVPLPIWEYPQDVFAQTIDINVTGVFRGIQAAAAHMIKQDPLPSGDRGWIINLASIFGHVGTPTASAYVASKHAVMGLTKTAALDLAPHLVHVNAICPGYVESALSKDVLADPNIATAVAALHPFRGIGVPDDVARIAVFLASEDARWVTGTGIACDGGYTAQ